MTKHFVLSVTLALAVAGAGNAGAQAQTPRQTCSGSTMRRSAAVTAAGCLPNAVAKVTVKSLGEFEIMSVSGDRSSAQHGLRLVRDSDFRTRRSVCRGTRATWRAIPWGALQGTFIGRFNEETFIVAPGTGAAPVVHNADAATNPPTAPVHTFHVGLWFNSPAEAMAAGCPNTVTPFNGEHHAGIQALSTNHSGP